MLNKRRIHISTRSRRTLVFSLASLVVACGLLAVTAYVSMKPKHIVNINGSVRAVDSANTISDPTWFKAAYNDGVRLYVLHSTAWGTCNPWQATQPQLKMALEAGLKVAAYTRDPQCWREGILATGPYVKNLQFFALDIETDPGVSVSRAMVDGIKNMGVRPVIYSGAAMWNEVQHGSTEDFSDIALWDTSTTSFDYSTWQANYLSPAPVKYGGWNTASAMRVGVQQQFEYNLNGVQVDLNSFDSKFLR